MIALDFNKARGIFDVKSAPSPHGLLQSFADFLQQFIMGRKIVDDCYAFATSAFALQSYRNFLWPQRTDALLSHSLAGRTTLVGCRVRGIDKLIVRHTLFLHTHIADGRLVSVAWLVEESPEAL